MLLWAAQLQVIRVAYEDALLLTFQLGLGGPHHQRAVGLSSELHPAASMRHDVQCIATQLLLLLLVVDLTHR
jgi:hypothetical protein